MLGGAGCVDCPVACAHTGAAAATEPRTSQYNAAAGQREENRRSRCISNILNHQTQNFPSGRAGCTMEPFESGSAAALPCPYRRLT